MYLCNFLKIFFRSVCNGFIILNDILSLYLCFNESIVIRRLINLLLSNLLVIVYMLIYWLKINIEGRGRVVLDFFWCLCFCFLSIFEDKI